MTNINSNKPLYETIADIEKDFVGQREYHVSCNEGEFDVLLDVNEDGTWAYAGSVNYCSHITYGKNK